jgi:RNA polymerase sigma factor (sigma-70 family)
MNGNGNDNDLINKILASNQPSRHYTELFNKYHARVLDKCYGFVKNRQLATELAEEIFAKAFEKLPTYNHKASFSSWLYAITYNHCIDYLRYKKKLHYPNWNRENEIPEIIDDTDEAIADINYDNLMVIMDLIHPEEKALLLMKYQHNLPIKDIAKALRVSEDAAKMRLKRARSRVLYLYTEKYLRP